MFTPKDGIFESTLRLKLKSGDGVVFTEEASVEIRSASSLVFLLQLTTNKSIIDIQIARNIFETVCIIKILK